MPLDLGASLQLTHPRKSLFQLSLFDYDRAYLKALLFGLFANVVSIMNKVNCKISFRNQQGKLRHWRIGLFRQEDRLNH